MSAAELVAGDIVLLGEGDVVPTDCDLLEASSILVDESALTGESVAVGKAAHQDESVRDELSSGTVVVKGRAVAVVTGRGVQRAGADRGPHGHTRPTHASATSPGRAGKDAGAGGSRAVPPSKKAAGSTPTFRLFLVFGLSGGAAETLVMLLGPFIGLVIPLIAAQILWINLLTHGITGVAMGAEPLSPDAMQQPPRPPAQSVLGDGLWQRVVMISVLLSATTLALGLWAYHNGRAWQTMIFLALTCLQLGVAVGLRPVQLTRQNPLLSIAVAGSFLLALAGVHVPLLQDLLGTSALPAAKLALAVGAGALGWLAARVTHS